MNQIAVFLDRDGVINYDPGNFHKIEELKILPRVGKAIRLLNARCVPVIVITNQPVIARGWITEGGVQKINQKIEKILEEEGARIQKFYFCPHHPNANLPKYRVVCDCRKPNVGLFKEAARDFNLDLKKSFVVGDSFRDIGAAKKLRCESVGIENEGSDFGDSQPDYKVKDLYGAAKLIVSLVDKTI